MAVQVRAITNVRGRTSVGWSPSTLFAANEQGVWYDPSDLTTLFQDAAGTTPVALYNWCSEEQFAPNPDDPENPIPLGPRVPCTQADIDALYATSDVTVQEPFVAFGRLGLQIVQTPMV